MSISISMPSSVTATASSASAGGGSQSGIEALQQKLVSLQKDLKEAINTQSKEGQAKAKMIQLQIAATQAQLDQLIRQKAQAAAEKQGQQHSESALKLAQSNPAPAKQKTSLIDEYV